MRWIRKVNNGLLGYFPDEPEPQPAQVSQSLKVSRRINCRLMYQVQAAVWPGHCRIWET